MRKFAAVCIGSSLFVLFWGSFILAEGDAYAPGHHGYIHAPWILGYIAAIILSVPGIPFMFRLWK